MRASRLTFLLLAFVMVFAVSAMAGDSEKKDSPPLEDATRIEWLDMAEGMELAKTDTGRHVLIDFTASWCGWCKRMDREAFSDSAVIARINDDFIPVKVWGDSDKMLDIDGYKISERNLAMSDFKVRGYPSFWFINDEGERIGPLPGYQTPERFLMALEFVAERGYDNQSRDDGESDK